MLSLYRVYDFLSEGNLIQYTYIKSLNTEGFM